MKKIIQFSIFILMSYFLLNATLFQDPVDINLSDNQERKNFNAFLNSLITKLDEDVEKVYPNGVIKFKTTNEVRINNVLNRFGFSDDITFEKIGVWPGHLDKAKRYKRYQQYYNGIKVDGGGYTLVTRNDQKQERVDMISPYIYSNIDINIVPNISREDLGTMLNTKDDIRAELIISNKYSQEYRLCWKVTYYSQNLRSAILDAHTGEVYKDRKAMMNLTGDTHTYGPRTLNDFLDNGTTKMQTPSGDIKVYEFIPNLLDEPVVDYSIQYNPSFIPSTTDNSSWNNDALTNSIQTLYTANIVLPSFESELSVDFGTVHIATNDTIHNASFGPIFSDYDNVYLSIGEYNGIPYSLFDVVAHELGHAYLHPILDRLSIETDGLHEGISDIIGTYIESKVQTLDWLMADDEMAIHNFNVNRDLKILTCYTDFDVSFQMNYSPHEIGVVIGHWYYLLSVGDASNNISAMGLDWSFDMLLDALNLVSPDATFLDVRNATLTYLHSIYGSCSTEFSSVANAWDVVCVGNGLPLCCDPNNDVVINSVVTYPNEETIGGTITIESGGELTVTSRLEFAELQKIVIKSGGKLILNGATLDKCEFSPDWQGIVVENGGELLCSSQSSILNARVGVNAYANSVLDLSSLTIDGVTGNNGTGVNLVGSLTDPIFDNLIIRNNYIGIKSINGQEMYEINSAQIIDCTFGIEFTLTPVKLESSFFSSVDFPITLNRSHCSMIVSNLGMNYLKTCITLNSSHDVRIEDNAIGAQVRGERAIISKQCENLQINNNSHIEADRIAIEVWGKNPTIKENDIYVSNSNYFDDGGIKLVNTVDADINHNYLDIQDCLYGIETNSTKKSIIANNDITLDAAQRSAGIRTLASLDEKISHNSINTQNYELGILAQNGSFAEFDCNDVLYSENGLRVNANSEMQMIRGNEFIGCLSDLVISSRIGLQLYEGNEFYNGSCDGSALDEEDIDASRFFVHDGQGEYQYHMPVHPTPNNNQWFFDDPNELNYYDDCSTAGPDWSNSNPGDNQLCNYFYHIKSIKDSIPEQFYVKLYHLLLFDELNDNVTLPSCILNDTIITQLCGLEDLVNANEAIVSHNTSSNDRDSLSTLQDNYFNARNEAEKDSSISQISQYLLNNFSTIDQVVISDSLSIDSLLTEIANIVCSDSVASYQIEALETYLDFLQNGEVSSNRRTSTQDMAEECSDTYGNAIHLSRALVHSYMDVNLEIFDDNCNTAQRTASRSTATSESDVSAFRLFPNPTNKHVLLSLNEKQSGKLLIFNVNAQLMFQKNFIEKSRLYLEPELQAGSYIVSLQLENGEQHSQKLIITN